MSLTESERISEEIVRSEWFSDSNVPIKTGVGTLVWRIAQALDSYGQRRYEEGWNAALGRAAFELVEKKKK